MAPEQALDLSFGLDDPNFSDKTLQLLISGDAVGNDDRPNWLRNVKLRPGDDLLTDSTPHATLSPPREKTIHITSLILAARSPFFRKLFSNGMRESEKKNVTLRIEAIEEASFMDLLKYVYSNNLPTTLDALLDLCLTADKYEVNSCLRDCTLALEKLPMTLESVSAYLDLPPCLHALQPLVHAAKKFLVGMFRDLEGYKEEVLNLPLLSFQVVISSDDLQAASEFEVCLCVLEWAYRHYSDLEERREILKTHLLHLVRFPFLTTKQLTEVVLFCDDIDPEVASKIVIRALSFKAETDPSRKRCLLAGEDSRQFVKRANLHRSVKVVELESHQECVVYLDLTRNEIKRFCAGGHHVWSETFYLDGHALGLSASCSRDEFSNQRKFWLALDVSESSTCTVRYEFAARRKPHENFNRWFHGTHTFKVGESLKNLHGEEWSWFTGSDSSYFINGVLHVRAELTLKKVVDE